MKHYGSYKFFIAIITIYQTKSKCSLYLTAVFLLSIWVVDSIQAANDLTFDLKQIYRMQRLFLLLAVHFLNMDLFFLFLCSFLLSACYFASYLFFSISVSSSHFMRLSLSHPFALSLSLSVSPLLTLGVANTVRSHYSTFSIDVLVVTCALYLQRLICRR